MERLIGRIPMIIVVFGVVLLTGGYRSAELSGGSQPVAGIGLVALGCVTYGGLWYLRE